MNSISASIQGGKNRLKCAFIKHSECNIMGIESEKNNQCVIFKRREELSPDDMLKYFDDFLNKDYYSPVYLIRESRCPGMLTISYKNYGGINHIRLAFMVDEKAQGRWELTSDEASRLRSQQSSEFQSLDATNANLVANAWPLLLKFIQGRNLGLRIDPDAGQATEAVVYKKYVTDPNAFFSASPKVSPLDTLEWVLRVYQVESFTQYLIDAFQSRNALETATTDELILAWVKNQGRDFKSLLHPQTGALLKAPWVTRTGKVYESSEVHQLDLTTLDSTDEPIFVSEWPVTWAKLAALFETGRRQAMDSLSTSRPMH